MPSRPRSTPTAFGAAGRRRIPVQIGRSSASRSAFSGGHRTSTCQARKSLDRPAGRAYDPRHGRRLDPTPRHGPRARPRGGAGRARRRPRRGPAGPLAVAQRPRHAHRPQPQHRRPARRGAAGPRARRRGRPGPEHRRPAAPPADVPRRRRPRPGRRPRRDLDRRRGDDARRPDPRPPRRAVQHRGRTGRGARSGRGAVRPAARDDARPARAGSGASASACPDRWSTATGRPISPPIMPGWDGYPVRERLADRYDAPVWVDNDVNVLAVGEWRSGVAAGYDNVVVVKVGTGIGAGIIVDGRLHRGAQGSAGDVGHIQVSEDRDVICRCGNVGCLEALAGGAAIARDGEAAAREGRSLRLREALDRRGDGHGRGRRAGGVVRRPGRGGAAPVRRPPDRRDARGRRELLQPVAGRHRRRRGPERRRAAGRDPRGGLRAVPAARHARPR